MANRYWVTGGTGNWNDTSNWSATSGGASGASVPGTSDTATFNASSGSGTATLDISPTIQTLTCTGFTGTLAFGTNTISLNGTGTVFTGATTMTVTGTPLIILTNNSATSRTISPTSVTEANSISFRVAAGTGSITMSTGGYRDLDFTDGTNPTGFAGAFGNNSQTVYGNFKASTGMTRIAGGSAITFAATSGTKTINTAGVTFDCPFTFNGVGGTWQLQAALTSGSTRTVTLTNGTLDLNNYVLTTGLFSSSNSNARAVAFGTGSIVLTGSNGTILNISTATNFSYTGTPTFNATYSGSVGTRTIAQGTSTTTESNAVSCSISAGSDIISTATAGTYKNLDFTGFTGSLVSNNRTLFGNLVLSSGMTVSSGVQVTTFAATSGTKTITTNGVSFDNHITFNGIGGTFAFQDAFTQGATQRFTVTNGTVQLKAGATSTVGVFATSGANQKYLQSTTDGSQATLSQATGTVDVSYLTIKDSNATGGATFYAYYDQGNVDAGNNTGWYFGASPALSTEVTYRLRSFTEPRRF